MDDFQQGRLESALTTWLKKQILDEFQIQLITHLSGRASNCPSSLCKDYSLNVKPVRYNISKPLCIRQNKRGSMSPIL